MPYIEQRKTKDGKTRWRAQARVRGYEPESATFDKKGDAVEWATEVELGMRMGRYKSRALSRKHTVGDMIDRYIDEVLDTKSHKKNWIAQQRRQLLWWKEVMGPALRLISLDAAVLDKGKAELLKKKRRASTVRRYFATINHVINTSIKPWGWMTENPIKDVSLPSEPSGRIRYLNEAELPALMAACKQERRIPLYELVVFVLSTGPRKGEALSLRCKDIDLARRTATIYDTKNSEPRILYLADYLCDMIRTMPSYKRGSKRLLFSTRMGHKLNIEHAWRKALKRAGIRNFRFHDLRHTFASYMAMNGNPLNAIGEALGHKDYKETKRYAHLSSTYVGGLVRGMSDSILAHHQARASA